MGVVQLRQIRSFLEANYKPHVELADYVGKPEPEQTNAALTARLLPSRCRTPPTSPPMRHVQASSTATMIMA